VFYTFTGDYGADVDLGLQALFPAVVSSDASNRVSLERWVFTVSARFFIMGEHNPLDDDL
jgi:hypothetical protein